MASKKEVRENELAALCRLVASLKDCADFFGVSHDTIERRVKEWGYASFASFREQNMVQTRFQLKRDLLERAKKSDVALIFALKNICGWADRVENTNIEVNKQDTQDLVAKAEEILQEIRQ
jgi:hypothetical protein